MTISNQEAVLYIILIINVLTPIFINIRMILKMFWLWRIIEGVNAIVPNINYGGCGWFALYLHLYLNKKGIKNEIIFLSFTGKKVPRHVVVKVGGAYIDNKLFYTKLSMWLFSKGDMQVKSVDELKHSLVGGRWNEKFNRLDTVKIKQIFEMS